MGNERKLSDEQFREKKQVEQKLLEDGWTAHEMNEAFEEFQYWESLIKQLEHEKEMDQIAEERRKIALKDEKLFNEAMDNYRKAEAKLGQDTSKLQQPKDEKQKEKTIIALEIKLDKAIKNVQQQQIQIISQGTTNLPAKALNWAMNAFGITPAFMTTSLGVVNGQPLTVQARLQNKMQDLKVELGDRLREMLESEGPPGRFKMNMLYTWIGKELSREIALINAQLQLPPDQRIDTTKAIKHAVAFAENYCKEEVNKLMCSAREFTALQKHEQELTVKRESLRTGTLVESDFSFPAPPVKTEPTAIFDSDLEAPIKLKATLSDIGKILRRGCVDFHNATGNIARLSDKPDNSVINFSVTTDDGTNDHAFSYHKPTGVFEIHSTRPCDIQALLIIAKATNKPIVINTSSDEVHAILSDMASKGQIKAVQMVEAKAVIQASRTSTVLPTASAPESPTATSSSGVPEAPPLEEDPFHKRTYRKS